MTKAEAYAQALFAAIQETKPEHHDKILDNLAKTLAQSGDIGLLSSIERKYTDLQLKAEGIKRVEITTAQHDPEAIKFLNDYIGENTEIKHKVDQGIIGGVVIRIDDTLIDASVKRQLEDLKNTMKG